MLKILYNETTENLNQICYICIGKNNKADKELSIDSDINEITLYSCLEQQHNRY